MHRLLAGQPGVAPRHAIGAIRHGCIALGFPLRRLVEVADPVRDPEFNRLHPPRRKIGHAVEHHQPRHFFRKRPGKGQADHAAHRVADDSGVFQAFGLHQAGQIVDVIGQAVAAAFRPLGIAVPAQIGRDDVKIRPQRPRHLVPAAGVIEAAMDQQQQWRRCVAPVGVVQPKSVRLVEARLRRVR